MTIPYIYSGGLSPDTAASGTLVLPANGGAVALPFPLGGLIVAQSITCRTTDTSGNHTLEIACYGDGGDQPGGKPMQKLGVLGSFTFTAVAAAVRTGGLGQPFQFGPGTIWVVCRNAGAATTTLSTAAAGGLGLNLAITATLGSLLDDLSTQAWTPTASLPLARINGSSYALQGGVL